ncbi:MAG: hypothetical protein K0B02_03300 [DPANN group archaeon]|nr:hypothetical protein [DPANN group archaeon]
MISQEAFDGLKSIGLNLYERKLYVSLIARSTATVGELSELASVPRSRAYDVLESLSEKGFVIIQNSKPLKYIAVAPSEALNKSKNVLKNTFSLDLLRIDKFSKSNSLGELDNLYSKGMSLVNLSDLSGSFKGEHSVNLHISNLFKGASKTIDLVTTETGVKDLFSKHASILRKAKDNGIKIRLLAPHSESNKDEIKSLKEFVDLKDLNVSDGSPIGKMAIIDGNHVVLGLTDDSVTHPSQEVSFWSASPHFANNFANSTFNMMWES